MPVPRNLDSEQDRIAERISQPERKVIGVKIAGADRHRTVDGGKRILKALFQVIPGRDQAIPITSRGRR